MISRLSTPLVLLLVLAPPLALAEDDAERWALCRPSSEIVPLPELGAADDASLRAAADRIEAENQGISRFSGKVVMLRSGQRIAADEATYDQNSDTLLLNGAVQLDSAEMSLSGSNARLNLGSDSGEVQGARYHVRSAHAFGGADSISIRDGQYSELAGATYTTCDPQKVDWLLRADRLQLDEASNTGEAWGVVVEFKGVPFLYLPYINFPLQGRKTGLLPPIIGSSNKTGTDIALPWYWNIAPNYDATLTPRYMSARGTQLQGEFRYLHPSNQGQLNLAGLPGDARYDDRDRYAASYRHEGHPADGWTNSIAYNRVSDPYYFNDLGNSLDAASSTHLERHVDLAYQGMGWNFLGRVQNYQTLTGTTPYQRLPQLLFNAATPQRSNSLYYSVESEAVNFAHPDLQPTCTRTDLTPAVSLPLQGPAWYLTPRLAVRQTDYQLQDAVGATALSRTTPIASLDSGLFFERDMSLGERPLLHTLEPRLYYLYVPYQDQDALPVFDSGQYDFTFAQLFRDNRFSGADRQGDANQVTVALTSRLLDGANGAELVRGSIGQIRYFADRRVTLPGDSTAEQQTSDLAAELAAQPLQDLNIAAATRWNPQDDRSEVVTTRARYTPDDDQILSVAYRYRRDQSLRQTDLVAFWPLSPRWHVLARWNYDLNLERTFEGVAGIGWQDCCWALHFIARQRLDTVTQQDNRSFMLTLELKGLSSLGRRLEDELDTMRY